MHRTPQKTKKQEQQSTPQIFSNVIYKLTTEKVSNSAKALCIFNSVG